VDTPSEFAVDVEPSSGQRVVLRVHGDLDMSTAGRVEDALRSVPDTDALVVDLSECTFLDSAGIRVLTSAIRNDRHVSIVAADPGIRRVLEITAVDTVVGVFPTLDDVD
jgi:anti-anti-sigma factor